jgi:hypothetical protein
VNASEHLRIRRATDFELWHYTINPDNKPPEVFNQPGPYRPS